jgi:hypothetical protein
MICRQPGRGDMSFEIAVGIGTGVELKFEMQLQPAGVLQINWPWDGDSVAGWHAPAWWHAAGCVGVAACPGCFIGAASAGW